MLNNGMVKDIVVNLLYFYAGRFSSAIAIDEIEEALGAHQESSMFFFEGTYGRDSSVVLVPEQVSDCKPYIARSISARREAIKDDSYYTALSALVRNLVFCLRTSPENIMVREQRRDGSFTRWLCVGELAIGEVLSKGLLASRCTYVFVDKQVSLFFDDEEVTSYHFKPPVYHNNVFWFRSE